MPKEQYSASEAAAALGISVDTLRRWERAGRVRATRDSRNRRVVSAKEIDRLRGDGQGTHLSARNRFRATVRQQDELNLWVGQLLAHLGDRGVAGQRLWLTEHQVGRAHTPSVPSALV